MRGGLIDMLAARTPRERVLLGLLVFVALPALLVTTVIWPAHTARLNAITAHNEAVAINNWVVARAAELPAENLLRETVHSPIGSTGIEQSLIEANLRTEVTDLGMRDGGIIELRFDAVTFTRLANWMSAQAPIWGYTISSFRFDALEAPGKVAARITLSPPT